MKNELLAKYHVQKGNAKARGIDFELTFEEWCEIWEGNFHRRGRGANQLGMLRTRDEGGYTKGNVRLGTPKENQQEASVARKVARAGFPERTVSRGFLASNDCWLNDRNRVFQEYNEDEQDV